MMLLRIALVVFVGLILTSVLVLTRSDSSPEKLIVGTWEEVSWEYELVNHEGALGSFSVTDEQKLEISENMIFHEAEHWLFNDQGQITFMSEDGQREVAKWTIKSRGNILQLEHANSIIEGYQIQQLTDDQMVIYFNFDLQVKGMVKMTFVKQNVNHA